MIKNTYFVLVSKRIFLYYNLTKDLKLDIINDKINGIEHYLKSFKTSKNTITLKEFSALPLAKQSHLIITSKNLSAAQIMTHSKEIRIPGTEPIESILLDEQQYMIFSFYLFYSTIENIKQFTSFFTIDYLFNSKKI